jgi:hypothetical protein
VVSATLWAAMSAHRAVIAGLRGAMVVTAMAAAKAVAAPAVVVTPMGPWTDAQEDAIVEIPAPVVALRRAAVRCVAVIAVGTGRRRTTDVDGNLRVGALNIKEL